MTQALTDDELAYKLGVTVDRLYEIAIDDGKILNIETDQGVWQKYAQYSSALTIKEVDYVGSPRSVEILTGISKVLIPTTSRWLFSRSPPE